MRGGDVTQMVKFVYYACDVSTTRMMILGLVRWLQPVHGYDVRRELLSWNAEEWANVQPGSIYHALRKLTEEGALAEVATEQVGARPARTTYRITAKGDREFQDLLRRYWWEPKVAVDPFAAAFAFLPALPRREAVAALRNRARLLEGQLEGARDGMDPEVGGWLRDKPVHVGWMFELGIERTRAEAAWCRRVADRIETGEGLQAGDVDEAEQGRLWREQIAAEFGDAPGDPSHDAPGDPSHDAPGDPSHDARDDPSQDARDDPPDGVRGPAPDEPVPGFTAPERSSNTQA